MNRYDAKETSVKIILSQVKESWNTALARPTDTPATSQLISEESPFLVLFTSARVKIQQCHL